MANKADRKVSKAQQARDEKRAQQAAELAKKAGANVEQGLTKLGKSLSSLGSWFTTNAVKATEKVTATGKVVIDTAKDEAKDAMKRRAQQKAREQAKHEKAEWARLQAKFADKADKA